MGNNSASTSKENIEKCKQLLSFTEIYLPQLLESEYCVIREGEFCDPMMFQIAFLNFLRMKNIDDIPKLLYQLDPLSETLKYYFNKMQVQKYSKQIYVSGSCKYNIIVGVSLKKWPGTSDTDLKAPMSSDVSLRLFGKV
jgi:hypothetical protein